MLFRSAIVDPDFAKEQMALMLQGVYLHPSGQLPAYEWNFSDVNPPVHAWATLFATPPADRDADGLTGAGDAVQAVTLQSGQQLKLEKYGQYAIDVAINGPGFIELMGPHGQSQLWRGGALKVQDRVLISIDASADCTLRSSSTT